jgi:Protein of unknown function (DUF3667)
MTKTCKNCGALNDGAYCVDCGQATAVKLLTVGELLRETLAAVYNLDSRVWRTLLPLILSPGKLTNEYVAGRRASYMPPFRTYLVFSLLFFLLVSLDDITIEDEVTSEAAPDVVAELRRQDAAETTAGRAAIRSLADRGIIAAGDAEALLAELERQPRRTDAAAANDRETPERPDLVVETPEDCDQIDWNHYVGATFGPRLLRACQRTVSAGPGALLREVVDHIPVLVFVSLPLVAGFMKLLYWFPPRRYVEHLTFLFHTHAFFFAFLLLIPLGGGLVGLIPWLDWPVTMLKVVGGIYVPVYLFVALRRVYGQSGWLTTIKYLLLGPIYLASLTATFLGGVLFAFVTI